MLMNILQKYSPMKIKLKAIHIPEELSLNTDKKTYVNFLKEITGLSIESQQKI